MPRGTRNPSKVFRAVLDQAREDVLGAAAKAAAFAHRGIRGDERAGALASFLRERLPGFFDVAKGEAIDYKDHRTGQLDVVVYDSHGSVPVSSQSENLVLPCEALYAVLEVKTTLTKIEIEKCIDSASKIRALRPFKKAFGPPQSDGAPQPLDVYRCMYVVVAYESNLGAENWAEKEYQRLRQAADERGMAVDLIDRVVVLDRGIINPPAGIGKTAQGGEDAEVFLEWYLHLINFLNREKSRRPHVDWQVYSSRTSQGWKRLSIE